MNIDLVISKTSDQRIIDLVEKFKRIYTQQDIFVARSPGRINLIGEHTDYNGCSVFPMAVDKDILAVCAPREDNKIIIHDFKDKFGFREFEIEKIIEPFKTGDWGNYPKAAVQGMINYFEESGKIKFDQLKGYNAVISSTIPSAGGMSSSSAFVVLSALMLLHSNNMEEDKKKLASLMAQAETYVGTQGGGMDQAACLLGKKKHALKMDFNPLRVKEVPVPEGYCVVVADTLKKASKTEAALQDYNRRSIECKIATAVVKVKFDKEFNKDFDIATLGDLMPEKLNLSQEEIDRVLETVLHPEFYQLDEVAKILNISEDEVVKNYCQMKNGQYLNIPEEGFKLYQRFIHVMTEWKRVEESVIALQNGDIVLFGDLMNQSHYSCRDNHEVSSIELDVLSEISRNSGALGARMTGAGFGGCTVSLVKTDKALELINSLNRKYYDGYIVGNSPELLKNITDNPIFIAHPSDGAGVIKGFELGI